MLAASDSLAMNDVMTCALEKLLLKSHLFQIHHFRTIFVEIKIKDNICIEIRLDESTLDVIKDR